MKRLSRAIINFFQNQGCVFITTVASDGSLHASCKGIVEVDPAGRIYLFDLYQAHTLKNLRKNNRINIAAVDEHKFIGYALKGTARIVAKKDIAEHILKAWDDKIISRLSRRIVRNMREEKGDSRHPEALMPRPEYLIVVDVHDIIDLRPPHLR